MPLWEWQEVQEVLREGQVMMEKTQADDMAESREIHGLIVKDEAKGGQHGD